MLSVLVVCTGNICRSPAAQLVLSSELDHSVEVTSAGTAAVVGAPVAAPMSRLLARHRVDASGFAARALTPQMVSSADLVLAMTRAHRAGVLALAPAALRRTVLFSEVAPIAEQVAQAPAAEDDGARLRAVLAGAGRARAVLDRPRVDLDVEDPYGRDEEVYERVLRRIRSESARLVAALRR